MTRRFSFVMLGLIGLAPASRAWAGAPLYDRQNDALDPQACGGTGCWTNYMRLTDLDGDDDLDILLANYPDFFSGSAQTEPLVFYANAGDGTFSNVSASALGGYLGSLRMVAVGDVDGDGSRDIFGPSGSGDAYVLFINDGSGVFTDEADTRMPGGPYPQGAAARMGDVDGDGDLDIFSADGYAGGGSAFGHIYINDGAGMFEELADAVPDAISGQDINDCELLDVDGDFDLDLFVNAHSGGTGALWLNDGTGVFSGEPQVDPPASANFHYNASPCDVDADGDLDMWIDNIGGGFTEQLLINDGAGNYSDETGSRVTGNPGEDDNGVVCADIDGDGDFDGVVLSLGTPERLLVNDGAGNFAFASGAFPAPTDATLWGEFGDINGDGRIDLVTSEGESSSSDEVFFANTGVPVDTVAPILRGVESLGAVGPDDSPALRFAVSDRTATDEGPRLARAYAVIDPEGTAVEVDATFIGGDLFRAVLPSQPVGTVTYAACAVDPEGNVGCSENQTYDVDGASTGTDGTGADTSAGTSATDPDSSGGSVSATASDTATASATATDSASATGGSDGSSSGNENGGGGDGCSCDATGRRSSAWLGVVFFGLGLLRRPGVRRRVAS